MKKTTKILRSQTTTAPLHGQKNKRKEISFVIKPTVTLLNGITIIVGSIIGSGIFIAPSSVLRYVGSINLALVVWMVTGIICMIGAYCYTELGCMITKTGADYAYVMETFGPMFGFIRLWMECMIIRPCTIAIIVLTCVLYASKPFFRDCDLPVMVSNLISFCLLASLIMINCWSTYWATKLQDYLTFLKLIAIVMIISVGMWHLIIKGNTEHFSFEYTNYDMGMIAVAHYSAMFAYNGWYYLNYIIEELVDPIRNLPIAVGVSITLVTILNVLMNVSFFTVLAQYEALSTDAIAVLFGYRAMGNIAFWVIPLVVALSALGAANGCILSSSRLFYAGAKNHHMPEFLIMVQIHRYTPVPSIICIGLLTVLYLFFGDIHELLNYLGFTVWASLGIGVLCVPVLRITRPDLTRPIKVNLIWPAIYIIFTICLLVFPVYHDLKHTVYGCLMVLTSIPVYFVTVKWNKPILLNRCLMKFTHFVQKLMLVLPETENRQF